ncbi:hypothetical protein MRX96_057558 [Rhipicephalus microplus]
MFCSVFTREYNSRWEALVAVDKKNLAFPAVYKTLRRALTSRSENGFYAIVSRNHTVPLAHVDPVGNEVCSQPAYVTTGTCANDSSPSGLPGDPLKVTGVAFIQRKIVVSCLPSVAFHSEQ